MRALHLGFDLLFLLPGSSGGRETYARELLRALRQERPSLTITAFVNRETAASGSGFWDGDTDRTVVLGGGSARSRSRWARAEFVTMPRLVARVGINVLHSPANVAPLHGSFARVVTVHDLLFPNRVARLLVRAGARRADRVITGSRWAARDLQRRLKLDPGRLDVVPHGVTPATPTAGGTTVLVLGADLPHKHLDLALEALAQMDPAERPPITFAGRSTDGGRLRARAAELGVEARFLGSVAGTRLETLYRDAALLISPSRGEGFGLTPLEAMARGVPVVASDIPPTREVAGDTALWFAPGGAGALAAAIEQGLRGGPEVDRLSTAGRERAAAFSWRRTAELTLASYDRALATFRQ